MEVYVNGQCTGVHVNGPVRPEVPVNVEDVWHNQGGTMALEKLAYTVAETVEVSGIGRTVLYRYLGSGELPSFTLGTRRLILRSELVAFLERRLAQEQATSSGKLAPAIMNQAADACRSTR